MKNEFAQPLLTLMRETFENSASGFYLDENNSLLETLAEITAEQASIPVGNKCASLAAQVSHVIYFIEVFESRITSPNPPQADWGYIWKTVEKISEPEWQALQEKLAATYQRMLHLFKNNPDWNENTIGGALSVLVHTTYHLGEIRQATCILK